jgi:hypothetical protein
MGRGAFPSDILTGPDFETLAASVAAETTARQAADATLTTAVAGKAPSVHTHTTSQITDLGSWAGSTAIVTLGTVNTGVWHGSVISPAYLGTGTRDGTRYLRDDGTWQAVAGGGSGSGGDLLSVLTSAEVSVTGTTTLTSLAFDKMHVCSGTSADYTVTLPAASGNAGKLIGVRMAAGLTKLVTLDGNGAETIDGLTTRVLWAQESAILLCDGAGWIKVAGRSIPMTLWIARGTDFSVSGSTWTGVPLPAFGSGFPGMHDTVNGRAVIVRPGIYQATVFLYQSGSAGVSHFLGVGLNSADTSILEGFSNIGDSPGAGSFSTSGTCAVGDYLWPVCYFTNAVTILGSVSAAHPFLKVTETPQW